MYRRAASCPPDQKDTPARQLRRSPDLTPLGGAVPSNRSNRSSRWRNLSSQPNTRSMVLNRSLKIAASKNGLRPRLADRRFLGFGLMFGTMPRLKIAFRLREQS